LLIFFLRAAGYDARKESMIAVCKTFITQSLIGCRTTVPC